MRTSSTPESRLVHYSQALPGVGVPFLAEIEEHFHKPCGRHDHQETQVLVILEGAMRIWAGDHFVTAAAGQACVIPPGLLHWVGADDVRNVRILFIDFRVAASAGALHDFLNARDQLQIRSGHRARINQTAKQLANLVRTGGAAQSARVMAALWSLVGELSGEDEDSSEVNTGIDRRLLAAERLMKEQLSREISVDDLAAATGLSRSQLCRLYAKSFQQSPAARLRQLRIEQADHLLTHSTLSIKEVSHVCGFACPNHFSRVYHEAMGTTPTDRRKI